MTVLAIPVAIYPTDRHASDVNYSFKNLISVVHALLVPLFLLTHVGYNKNNAICFMQCPSTISVSYCFDERHVDVLPTSGHPVGGSAVTYRRCWNAVQVSVTHAYNY